jgi:uncharacterized membrane protein YkoI
MLDISVITQSLKENSSVGHLMQSLNVSRAKANIIDRIVEIDARMPAQSLARLSINDLNLLVNAKHLNLGGVSVSGSASSAAHITAQQALNVATHHADLNPSDISHYIVELEEEDGEIVYEIEFVTASHEYQYLINAKNSQIAKVEIDEEEAEDDEDNAPANKISRGQALQTALSHAGFNQSNISSLEIEFDFDDPLYIYEISFETPSSEYEYEINCLTGAIISYSVD